jgi:NIMA (never in mitosis gene a)-related kinase
MKSANIFLSGGLYKLGDLNVSKVNKGRLAYTQTGTPYYASPEVWRDEPYDSKSDIWSFGCIIYEMACLKPPFGGQDMESLYRNVQRGIYDRVPSCYSRDLETVVGLCLQKNPKLRPSST